MDPKNWTPRKERSRIERRCPNEQNASNVHTGIQSPGSDGADQWKEKPERGEPGIWHQRYGDSTLAARIYGTSATDF
jgi:hypothetical protein